MDNKILVIVYIPMIEKEYDVMIPVFRKIGTIKSLIIKTIKEDGNGEFLSPSTTYLYDKKSGNKLDDNIFVKHSVIVNGSKLILY